MSTETKTERKMDHSPTPWFWHGGNSLSMPNGGMACTRRGEFGDPHADAEFICRACNSYDELLAALEEFVGDVNTVYRMDTEDGRESLRAGWFDLANTYEAARAAIAKATGETP